MPAPQPPAFDTLSLHAGQRPDAATGARATPIYETTSFAFESVDHAAALFDLETPGHIYSRISNPTVAVLEERVAALEGGVGAVATASGMAALHLAIATLAGAGDHIVASASLYGGTVNLLARTLPRFGVTTTFVPPRDLDAFKAAIRPQTRLVLGETIGNPGLEVLDIPAVAEIAHAEGLPLVIDNTFATPWACRPIDLGADIVMHSLTKWIGGHGLVIGGALVDGGKFDWLAAGRHPTLSEPDPGYHGLNFAEHFGPAAFIMRARAEGLRDFGACLSPHNAARLLTGVETLGLRMARHFENTGAVLKALQAHPAVSWVNHPSLPEPSRSRTGEAAAAARRGLDRHLRRQGRPGGGRALHRGVAAGEPSRQCRRRQDAGHPSRQHHPSPDERRGTRQGGRRRGHGAAVGRASRRRKTSSPISNRRSPPRSGADMRLIVDGKPVLASDGGGGRTRRTAAGDLPARRRHGPQRLGEPDARLPAARPRRAGRRPARPRRLRGAGARRHRRAGRLDAGADDSGGGRARQRSSATAWGRSSRSRPPRARRERVARLALVGVGAKMPVHPDLLAAAEANDHAAVDMVSLWSLGGAARGGCPTPGLWMLGGTERLLELSAPGVLHTDLGRLQRLSRRAGGGGPDRRRRQR